MQPGSAGANLEPGTFPVLIRRLSYLGECVKV